MVHSSPAMKQTSRPHSPAASSQEPQIALQSLIEAITRAYGCTVKYTN